MERQRFTYDDPLVNKEDLHRCLDTLKQNELFTEECVSSFQSILDIADIMPEDWTKVLLMKLNLDGKSLSNSNMDDVKEVLEKAEHFFHEKYAQDQEAIASNERVTMLKSRVADKKDFISKLSGSKYPSNIF